MSRLASRALVALIVAGGALAPRPAAAVFASPVNGGCYMTSPGQCRIHIDPVTINVASGQKLQSVQVRVNGNTIYDYRTDLSNPPPLGGGTTFTFSPVGLDFAALCGKAYEIHVVAKDTGDANGLAVGGTSAVTCPERKAIRVPN